MLLNIKLFRAFHNNHIVVSQTKQRPFLDFLFFADTLTQSKRTKIFGGIIITTPSQLKISYHTQSATFYNEETNASQIPENEHTKHNFQAKLVE
jgi:hypothetical protein